MSGLRASLQERNEFRREGQWRDAGVTAGDISFSKLSGMDARDIRVFREFSARGWMFVVRCPKVAARAMHGIFPPKIMAVKAKTGTSGAVVDGKGIFVSDYDMMSVWRFTGAAPEKVFMPNLGDTPAGPLAADVMLMLGQLNRTLIAPLQHGCQDDFHNEKNPGVGINDHFAAFIKGGSQHLATREDAAAFYAKYKLGWSYDGGGKYNDPTG